VHRILLRTAVLDFAPEVHDQAVAFWERALLAAARPGTVHPEYQVLEHPAALGAVIVQRLGTGPSRVHLDVESDDPAAEVARLLGVGATLVGCHDDWTVLADPAGVAFCVVPAEGDDFAERAFPVGE
jgi:Glyoxalase-like domain